MTIKENVTIYKCDFCKKESKSKGAMTRHEKKCSGNPVNYRPCLSCNHLERRDIDIEFDSWGEDGVSVRTYSGFYCAAKQIMLLHPKTQFLKHRGNLTEVLLGGKEVTQTDMPLSCEKQNSGYDDYLNDFFQ